MDFELLLRSGGIIAYQHTWTLIWGKHGPQRNLFDYIHHVLWLFGQLEIQKSARGGTKLERGRLYFISFLCSKGKADSEIFNQDSKAT